jgi:predicted membrane-bound mannosyltransferase
VAGAVLATATILRVHDLAMMPLHHDEGVDSFFLLSLFREGVYSYNAANYHGPTLYYFGLITCSVNNLLFGTEGPSTIAIRVVPVIFGVGIVALL